MEQRYIANKLPRQTLTAPPIEMLQSTLEETLRATPPLDAYSQDQLGGLSSGYTGLAYLFLQISATYPSLEILGHKPLHWARRYLDGDRGVLTLQKRNCGLASEKLSYEAVLACVTQDISDVILFLSNIPVLLGPYVTETGDFFSSELIHGRAGALYMLRMVRQWVPDSAALVRSPILRLAEKIVSTEDASCGDWKWQGTRNFGASQGDIGIITQLVLSVPSLAPQLYDQLADSLALQRSDGNWPPSSQKTAEKVIGSGLVHCCHGASGFISSLQVLQPFSPQLDREIDQAVARAQEFIWRCGQTREPTFCHCIFGNAL